VIVKFLRPWTVALCGAALAACGNSTGPSETADSSADAETAEAETPTASPGDHVSFFVIGKSWNFDQDSAGNLNLVDMGYFAEIFKTAGGEVSDAFMQLDAPGAEPIPFDDEGDGGAVLYGGSGIRHQALETLDAELPNGNYVFRFSTPAGDVDNFGISLADADGQTHLPPGPVISLTQNGEPVASDAVAPGVDVLVSWTPFATGRADPNGIADDLIFVMMSDCNGDRAFHSGRPLATPNPLEPDKPSDSLLTYANDEVLIPGSAWRPGVQYTLDVEHARLLDTDRRQGVVGMSTFAVTTHLPVRVTGTAAPGDACPEDD
jgi:hypothetical protein